MKKMLNTKFEFTIKGLLTRIIVIVLVGFGLVGWMSPKTVDNWREKWNQKEATVEVEEPTTKEYMKVYRCDNLFVVLYTDDSYYAASTLDEAAIELTNATGKSFAAANGNLYEVEGGKLTVVKVDVYR